MKEVSMVVEGVYCARARTGNGPKIQCGYAYYSTGQ